MVDIKTQFKQAAQNAKQLSGVSNDDMLCLYGLFKQASAGDCQGSRPGMFNPKNRAKWDAWNSRKSMAANRAMQLYVEKVEKLAKR